MTSSMLPRTGESSTALLPGFGTQCRRACRHRWKRGPMALGPLMERRNDPGLCGDPASRFDELYRAGFLRAEPTDRAITGAAHRVDRGQGRSLPPRADQPADRHQVDSTAQALD